MYKIQIKLILKSQTFIIPELFPLIMDLICFFLFLIWLISNKNKEIQFLVCNLINSLDERKYYIFIYRAMILLICFIFRKGYDLAPISGGEGWVPMYLHD
jgi:hypothetical protein